MHDYVEMLYELGEARKEICRLCHYQAKSIARITRSDLRNHLQAKLLGVRLRLRKFITYV